MSKNALLGMLSILTQVDTSKLTDGLGVTSKSVKRGVAEITSSLSGMVPALGALASVGGTVGLALSGLKRHNDLKNVADLIGTTTQELAQLEHVATRTGTGTEAVRAGLKNLNKELAAGLSGDKSNGLSKLGLEIEQLRGKSATGIFVDVAAKLGEIEDPALRAAAAAGVFGKAAAGLDGTLSKSRAEIEALVAESERFGAVLDGDQTAAVNAANSAWDEFKAATAGASTQLAAGLAPAFEGVLEMGTLFLTDFLRPAMPLLAAIGGGVKWVAGGLLAFGTSAVAATHGLAYLVAKAGQWLGLDWNSDGHLEKMYESLDVLDEIGKAQDDFAQSAQAATRAAAAAYGDLNTQLSESIKLFGLSETEKKIYEAAKSGASQPELDDLYKKSLTLRALDQELKLRNDIAAVGRDSAAVEADRLAAKGLDVAVLRNLAQELQLKQQLQKAQELLTSGIRERQTAGMNKFAAAAHEGERNGMDAGMVARLRLEGELHDKAADAKKLAEETAQAERRTAERILELKEKSLSVGDRMKRDMQEVENLFIYGKLSLDEFVALRNKIQNEGDPFKNRLPYAGAAYKGSEEARETLLRGANFGNAKGDPFKALEKNGSDQVRLLVEANRIARAKEAKKFVRF